jgi:hypothetical protein
LSHWLNQWVILILDLYVTLNANLCACIRWYFSINAGYFHLLILSYVGTIADYFLHAISWNVSSKILCLVELKISVDKLPWPNWVKAALSNEFGGSLNHFSSPVWSIYMCFFAVNYHSSWIWLVNVSFRSDVLGQVMPFVGRDWSHSGVARLFSAIKVWKQTILIFGSGFPFIFY